MIRLEQFVKARNNAASAVDCLESAKAVKQEEQIREAHRKSYPGLARQNLKLNFF